ncbi:MAG: bacteriohopanetetrol glucosamine biosynthesis glycosyltransferase HpnI [Acidobacteriia bacterium]|nr:bacteriohopanetetrol glucosamine biosynthesis glycosyltransferase HpnI [Terriglobia bacterium]
MVYCLLVIIAARRYLRQQTPRLESAPPISVLTPLHGAEAGLEENLRSSFAQRYPQFELLFAFRQSDDPASAIVHRLMAEFPQVRARILITGEPPYPNAKVFSLHLMQAAAQFDLLVMKDSDVRTGPEMLERIASEFQDARVGMVTCPYLALAVRGFWWKLDALGMNTQFLGGVLVARMLEGMKFALGPAIAVRRSILAEMGGIETLNDYLAEDFVIGQTTDRLGHRVILSSYRIEHHIGGGSLRSNLLHRLRWVRSTRRSRPSGYVGELFTNPLPLALALCLWEPRLWPVALASALLRALAAWVSVHRVLRSRLTFVEWMCLPLQDLLSFVFWVAGFFGNTVLWRGRQYYLGRDGRIALIG